ncbi:MAG: pyrroloquinoline quinone biosynthesis protein PqqB [Hyphomicrobiales bacterium]|nr:pyrroloquinoline quinone biosynthesis protein PqqB [Hyphomicrobiales bacterium]
MLIRVLGSAAGGGFPQWNCRCPVCTLAWNNDPRVSPRTQSSLAISADGHHWLLLNASPDLRQQISAHSILHPVSGRRGSPIYGIWLTNGDIDHVAGLLSLREQQSFTIFATRGILDELAANAIFSALAGGAVTRRAISHNAEIAAGYGLDVTSFAVPGKVPLYREGARVSTDEISEMTSGLNLRHGGRTALYIPGCARVTPDIKARIAGADVVLFDGTTFVDDEMLQLGLSNKTAARMGHLAMSGPAGSMAALADVVGPRKIFIHINNTNPALIEGSPERRAVEAAGWEIAFDGMEIDL